MIEKLTPEQEARLPEFRDFGLRIGLSTERSDRDAGTAAIKAHYKACGLDEPEVLWFDSPYQSVAASVRDSVRASVWASVWASVEASVEASVRASVRASVGDSVGAPVGDSVRASVGASVWDSVGASVRASVGASVWASVWASVEDSVGASVGDSVRASVGDSVRASVGAHCYADDAAWFMAWKQYGISLPPSALTFIKAMEHCWWWYPGEKIVFASDRPTAIRRNTAGKLHSENNKAIEFSDGTGFCAWNGVTLPDKWVFERATIDPTEIIREQNVEKRAAGCACVGWPRMLSVLPYKIIDSDPDPMHGELIEIKLTGLPKPGRFLMAECPRNATICEGVPSEISTVLEAQAWRVGLTPSEFSYPSIRT